MRSQKTRIMFDKISEREDRIGREIVHAAFKVHKELGPGLLEKIYEVCLAHELKKEGLEVIRQLELPIYYDGMVFEEALRLDIIVEDLVIVECKAVEQTNPLWKAQVLSHLKLTNKRLGYLINFNVALIKHGITRIVR